MPTEKTEKTTENIAMNPRHKNPPCKSRQVSNVRDRRGYLFIEVGQPVHALELVTFEFAIEDGGLRNVFTCMDGWVGKAVALSEPRA